MAEIQDQFAQFVERWRGYLECDPAPSSSENFEEKLRDFAREFVEECLDEIEFCRKCGNPMDSPKMLEWIRQHFAWLKK